jgi:hypothetical protein
MEVSAPRRVSDRLGQTTWPELFNDGDGMTHGFGRALPFTADGGKESREALVFPYFEGIVPIWCRNGKTSASAS